MSFSAGKNLQNNINTTEAQTLSNKTLDNTNAIDGASIDNSTITGASLVSPTRADVKKDTQANLETYAATATEGQLVYATDTKTMYQIKNNALSEVSGGAGGINYIENPDAEINVDGWTRYLDAVSEIPEDGSGAGIVDITFTRNTTNPLRGTADFNLNKIAQNAQGQGVSYDFTIDVADQAKKLTISFDYDASDANYADDDIKVFIYDVTNTTLIRVNGEDLKGGKGTHYAQFQTAADSTSYRLILHVSSTNAAAYDVFFDNVKVGPREVAFGSLVTDWKEFTPSSTQGLGTITGVNLEYRRVGDSLQVRGELTVGSTTAVEAQLGLPNNYVVKAQSNTTVVGTFFRGDTTNANGGCLLATDGDTYVNFSDANVFDGAGTPQALTPAFGNASISSSERISIQFEVPIQGWSSNAVSSEDLGGREIVVEAEGSSQGSVASGTSITFATEVKDTTSSFDGTTFTVPESGEYLISSSCGFTSGVQVLLQIEVNGTDVREFRSNANGGAGVVSGSSSLSLVKGDTVEIVLSDSDSSSINILNTARQTNLSIQKLASPQTILETETVAARYTSNSGQTVSSGNNFVFEDLDFDTHNAYNVSTGVYTVPISGLYDIEATALNANNVAFFLSMELNGSEIQESQNNDAEDTTVIVRTKKMLNKGDEIQIVNSAGSNKTLTANGNQNTFSIARIK